MWALYNSDSNSDISWSHCHPDVNYPLLPEQSRNHQTQWGHVHQLSVLPAVPREGTRTCRGIKEEEGSRWDARVPRSLPPQEAMWPHGVAPAPRAHVGIGARADGGGAGRDNGSSVVTVLPWHRATTRSGRDGEQQELGTAAHTRAPPLVPQPSKHSGTKEASAPFSPQMSFYRWRSAHAPAPSLALASICLTPSSSSPSVPCRFSYRPSYTHTGPTLTAQMSSTPPPHALRSFIPTVLLTHGATGAHTVQGQEANCGHCKHCAPRSGSAGGCDS